VNERIRVREVRLIDEEGAQAGVVPTSEALGRAREAGLDLIEVAPNATPPVCRIMDYGKYKYQQQKREKESRKKHRQSQLRMIKVRPHVDTHDFETKLKSVRKFLEQGDKVRVTVFFRYRELSHPEFGQRVLQQFVQRTEDVGSVERPPAREGRQLSMVLIPKPGAAAKKAASEPREKPPKAAAEAQPAGES